LTGFRFWIGGFSASTALTAAVLIGEPWLTAFNALLSAWALWPMLRSRT
jgi:hypothetical protein